MPAGPLADPARRSAAALRRRLAAFAALLGLAAAPALAAADWRTRLQAEVERIERQSKAGLGVYLRDLDSGEAYGFRATETWYLASTVKLPVAIAVLQSVQRGEISLETPIALRAADLVDGAGPTAGQRIGTPLTVRYLLDQMLVWSDNTASDMLIELVGLRSVNNVAALLAPGGFRPITTLADVRRHVYAQLDPAATHLSGADFLLLKQQPNDEQRLRAFGRLVDRPVQGFRVASLAEAYDAYYASGLNSARLDAYGELLEHVVRGEALDASHTAYLLGVMERVQTGAQRIRAGLAPGMRFAHKTGTQRARTCDAGLVRVPRPGGEQRVIVAACTRGESSLRQAERMLREVGAAMCGSGLLTGGRTDDPACPATPHAAPLPAGTVGAHRGAAADGVDGP